MTVQEATMVINLLNTLIIVIGGAAIIRMINKRKQP